MSFFNIFTKASEEECIELLTEWYANYKVMELKEATTIDLLHDIKKLLPVGVSYYVVDKFLWKFDVTIDDEEKAYSDDNNKSLYTLRLDKCIGNPSENISGKLGELIKKYIDLRNIIIDQPDYDYKIVRRIARWRKKTNDNKINFVIDDKLITLYTNVDVILVSKDIVVKGVETLKEGIDSK